MKKREKLKRKFRLKLISFIFFSILLSFGVLTGVTAIFNALDYLTLSSPFRIGPITMFIFFVLGALIVGLIITSVSAKWFLKPINDLSDAMDKVAKGDFSVELDTDDETTEIGELIRNFNQMVKDLRQVETLKTDFISNVSHEFKTPLTTIQGYSTLLQDETLSKDEREAYTKYIIHATKQLSSLIGNILKLSKIENGTIKVEKTKYDVAEQIRQAILFLEPQWSIKNIDLDIDLVSAEIEANNDLLMQVWMNIINNAIKFSDYAGKIIITSCLSEGNYSVTIKDFGCGMNEQTKKRLFEKFYQGDNSHSKEGNGLGLTLVKKVLDISGGSISVESKEGQGSEFNIIIPLRK